MRILRNLSDYNNPTPNAEGRGHFAKHCWPFKLDNEWEYVNNLKDADIVPVIFDSEPPNILRKLNVNQTALVLAIFHIAENYAQAELSQFLDRCKKIFPNVILVHKNKAIEDTHDLVYYDSMFNRQKLYFTEYDRLVKFAEEENTRDIVWTPWMNKDIYTSPEVNKVWDNSFKPVLSPNLVYEGFFVTRMRYRAGLKDYIDKNFPDKCIKNTKDQLLLPNNPRPALVKYLNDKKLQGGFWFPLADEYYNKSLVSAYVETLTMSHFNTKCVTEKTFDPLVKGNFILPFAYKNFLKDVTSYGFQLPPFIDYTYDSEYDDNVRFDRFLTSLGKLLRRTDLQQQYEKFKPMLIYNRKLFFDRPYYTLYDKIKRQVETRPKPEPSTFKSAI
jgi:hypothetical protein